MNLWHWAPVPGKYPCHRFLHLYDEIATMVRACRYEPKNSLEILFSIKTESIVITIAGCALETFQRCLVFIFGSFRK